MDFFNSTKRSTHHEIWPVSEEMDLKKKKRKTTTRTRDPRREPPHFFQDRLPWTANISPFLFLPLQTLISLFFHSLGVSRLSCAPTWPDCSSNRLLSGSRQPMTQLITIMKPNCSWSQRGLRSLRPRMCHHTWELTVSMNCRPVLLNLYFTQALSVAWQISFSN